MRFKDSPDPAKVPSGSNDKVLHSCFRVGNTRIMASDGHCQGEPSFQGFSLSLMTSDVAEADRLFKALEKGGPGADAIRRDVLLPTFWNGGGPLRRLLDGHRHARGTDQRLELAPGKALLLE